MNTSREEPLIKTLVAPARTWVKPLQKGVGQENMSEAYSGILTQLKSPKLALLKSWHALEMSIEYHLHWTRTFVMISRKHLKPYDTDIILYKYWHPWLLILPLCCCSAADKGHYEVIRVLASYGADLGKVNTQGNTSLHIAALKGHGQICKFLAQRGDCHSHACLSALLF